MTVPLRSNLTSEVDYQNVFLLYVNYFAMITINKCTMSEIHQDNGNIDSETMAIFKFSQIRAIIYVDLLELVMNSMVLTWNNTGVVARGNVGAVTSSALLPFYYSAILMLGGGNALLYVNLQQ